MLLSALGLSGAFAREQAFVTRLSLDETLLYGVLCFMLFARLRCRGNSYIYMVLLFASIADKFGLGPAIPRIERVSWTGS